MITRHNLILMLCCVKFQVRRFKTSEVKWYALKVKLFADVVIAVKRFWSSCVLTLYSRTLSGNASLFVPKCRAAIHYQNNACLNAYHFKQKNWKTYIFSLWPPLSHNKSSLIHKIAALLPSLPLPRPFCMAKNNWKQWLGPWQEKLELFIMYDVFQRKETHPYSNTNWKKK